jgi:hypothetical protein
VLTVSGIGEEGAFEKRQLKYSTMLNRTAKAQLLPSAPFLPIPYWLAFYTNKWLYNSFPN